MPSGGILSRASAVERVLVIDHVPGSTAGLVAEIERRGAEPVLIAEASAAVLAARAEAFSVIILASGLDRSTVAVALPLLRALAAGGPTIAVTVTEGAARLGGAWLAIADEIMLDGMSPGRMLDALGITRKPAATIEDLLRRVA
jgi:DNA-binding NarL/FixJ family response regulator